MEQCKTLGNEVPMETWIAILKTSLTLFAIINPMSSIPLFLQLTNNMDSAKRQKAFRTGVVVSALILVAFIFAGKHILTNFFQIDVNDLAAAGGLLLLLIAIDHLVFGSLERSVLKADQQDPNHIGAVPIACPILAGPGAMMTVLLTTSRHGPMVALASLAIVIGATWLILRFIDNIYRILGKTACTVLSKVFCLFIAAIGMRLLMTALKQYFA